MLLNTSITLLSGLKLTKLRDYNLHRMLCVWSGKKAEWSNRLLQWKAGDSIQILKIGLKTFEEKNLFWIANYQQFIIILSHAHDRERKSRIPPPPNLSIIDPYTMTFLYNPTAPILHKDSLIAIMIQNKNTFSALPQFHVATHSNHFHKYCQSNLLVTIPAYTFCSDWNSHVRWYRCNMRILKSFTSSLSV